MANKSDIVMGSILMFGLLGLGVGFVFIGFLGGIGLGIISGITAGFIACK